jgi:hypothetical protein
MRGAYMPGVRPPCLLSLLWLCPLLQAAKGMAELQAWPWWPTGTTTAVRRWCSAGWAHTGGSRRNAQSLHSCAGAAVPIL